MITGLLKRSVDNSISQMSSNLELVESFERGMKNAKELEHIMDLELPSR